MGGPISQYIEKYLRIQNLVLNRCVPRTAKLIRTEMALIYNLFMNISTNDKVTVCSLFVCRRFLRILQLIITRCRPRPSTLASLFLLAVCRTMPFMRLLSLTKQTTACRTFCCSPSSLVLRSAILSPNLLNLFQTLLDLIALCEEKYPTLKGNKVELNGRSYESILLNLDF